MWFAVLVPPAQAATKVEVVSARLIDERGIDHSTSELIVRGDDAGGELRLTSGAGGAVTVSDTADVTVGKDCALQADGSARCTFPYVLTRIDVEAAGGDDHVIVAAPSAAVSGGPGADTLEGYVPATELGSFFDGGPGDDVIRGSGTLVGGPGRDVLLGGPGSDFLNGDGGAPLEPDVIDGGDGRSDWVLFAGASEPVVVDLADPGPDGGDSVTNVEGAVGGEGDDRIAGTDGDNWLDGRGGDDVIVARGGADRLSGQAGDDTLDGGAGDDRLEGEAGRNRLAGGEGDDELLPDGGRGVVACGGGSDWLFRPGLRMTVPRDCEKVTVDYFDLTRLRVGRALRFTLQYFRMIIPPCRTNLTVLRGGRTVATTSIRTLDYRRHRVSVPLRGRGPLRLVFRSAENCRKRSGGPRRGGFMVNMREAARRRAADPDHRPAAALPRDPREHLLSRGGVAGDAGDARARARRDRRLRGDRAQRVVLGDLVGRRQPHVLMRRDVRERRVDVLDAKRLAGHERVQGERVGNERRGALPHGRALTSVWMSSGLT
jgi:hypothetical protein